jgi:hypothetical protein
MNTSIRVIAGGVYYSNNLSSNVQLTMPTPTASNDYLNIEFIVSQPAYNAGYGGRLRITLPSTTAVDQFQANYVTYVYDCNSTYWAITSSGVTSYSN